MTICRFFAQGNCRYGDRCRFEHVENDYNYNNQWDTENYRDQYRSNYNRYDNEYRNQRNYYNRSSGQNNQHQQQYRTRQSYNPQFRTSEQNFGKKQNQYSYDENESVYDQNRYRWLSDDYKNQSRSSVGQNEYENDSYTTSTPKGKPSFSFKVPESEVKKGSGNFFQLNEQEHLLKERVQDDAKSWELGGQWPFTSYFPCPNKCAFPGFYDVSPEELRYAAYKAEQNDSSEAYVQGVQNALSQINQQRTELQIASPQLLNTLRKINNGEDVYSASQKFNPIVSGDFHNNVEIMEMPDISSAANNAASSFSFKTPTVVNNAASSFSFKAPFDTSNAATSFSFKTLSATNNTATPFSFKAPSETDSAAKTSASSFSFKLPSGSETKPIITSASDGDVNIYTPFGNLTDDEKEQFSASTFVLGKIPTKPPSLVYCN